jgi:GntR family transcriptional regulator of arabinose operon
MAASGSRKPSQPGPMALDLASRIRRHINGRCSPGERLPTEAGLALQYGRSITTVRSALALLAEEGLVVRRQGSGTYVGANVTRTAGCTGVMYPAKADRLLVESYLRQMYQGILEAMPQTDRHIRLYLSCKPEQFRSRDGLAGQMDTNSIDSMITIEVFDQGFLAGMGKRIPTVAMDVACFQPGVSSCYADHEQNVSLAVEHLRRLGHRRLGLIGHVQHKNPDPSVPARCLAFERAIRHHSLPFAPQWIAPAVGAEESVKLVDRWRQAPEGSRPTAMICIGCHWAIAHAALVRGIRVPGQLSLLGLGVEDAWQTWVENVGSSYDVGIAISGAPSASTDPTLAPLCNMTFTSIRIPFAEMGRWAVAEVLRRLDAPRSEPQHAAFDGVIRAGNTVGPPLHA